MKNKIKSFLFILILCINFNCKNNCNTKTFEDQIFDQETLNYKANEIGNLVIFLDQDSIEHEYILSPTSGLTSGSNYFDSGCEDAFYEANKKLMRLRGPENNVIAFSYLITFIESENSLKNERLVDLLTISIFDESSGISKTLNQFQIITSNKNGEVNKEEFNNLNFSIKNNVTIQGKEFDEVFESNNSNPIIYNKEIGVVAFFDKNNKQLVFDRFE